MWRMLLQEAYENLGCRLGMFSGNVQCFLLRVDGEPIIRVIVTHGSKLCRHARHVVDLDIWQMVELSLRGSLAESFGDEEERSEAEG